MVGSIAPRMMSITLPHVAMWNVWFSQYGNNADRLAEVVRSVHGACSAVGRDPSTLRGSAAVFVRTPRGVGRTMGDPEMSAPPIEGDVDVVAEQLRAMCVPGIDLLQLVVDPIDATSIEWLGAVLELLRR